jgi:hypothetical protein
VHRSNLLLYLLAVHVSICIKLSLGEHVLSASCLLPAWNVLRILVQREKQGPDILVIMCIEYECVYSRRMQSVMHFRADGTTVKLS